MQYVLFYRYWCSLYAKMFSAETDKIFLPGIRISNKHLTIYNLHVKRLYMLCNVCFVDGGIK